MAGPAILKRVESVPYGEFHGFSKLFCDYAAGTGSAAGHYARAPWNDVSLAAAAQDAARATHPDRSELVGILRRQQPLWGQDPVAVDNVERLADPEASVVITGQQVGLFTGPAYTVLKALTAVLLARHLEQTSGQPVVPVFWLGSEDHDLAEMGETWIPGRPDPVHLTYDAGFEEGKNPGPVGSITFDAGVDELVAQLEAGLPPTDHLPGVMEAVRSAYHAGTTFRDGFGKLLRALLPDSGLVLFGPDDPEVKRLAAPLWRREIEDWQGSDAVLRRDSEAVAVDYHEQVHIRPTNLFLLHDGQRLPLDATGTGFNLRGAGRDFSREELLDLLDSRPEAFSPNVVMRPLTQDWLFPTAAYVAGPGETAYFGQYRGVYEWAGIPMPVIWPRVSVSFIEPGIRKSLDRLDLPARAFGEDSDRVFARMARERMEVDVEGVFGDAAAGLDRVVDAIAPTATGVDPSLERSAEATRASLRNELNRLRDRVLKADRRNQDQLRQQIEKVAGGLFPLGKPQERIISPLYFTAKYGPHFFSHLLESLSTETRFHLLVDV